MVLVAVSFLRTCMLAFTSMLVNRRTVCERQREQPPAASCVAEQALSAASAAAAAVVASDEGGAVDATKQWHILGSHKRLRWIPRTTPGGTSRPCRARMGPHFDALRFAEMLRT